MSSPDAASTSAGDGSGGSNVELPSPAPTAVAESPASSHLFGRGLLYVVVWSMQLVVGTVVSPILAYVLGPSEFGSLSSAIALHQVLTVFALPGLDQALVLQRAEDGNDRSSRGLVTVGIAISCFFTLLAAVTGPLWSSTLGFGHFSALVVATILWTAPGAAVQVILALLLAQDRLKVFSIVSVVAAVGGQVVGILLLLLVHNDATTYAWGGVVSQFAAMLLGVIVTRPRWQGLIDWRISWRAVKLGVPLAMGALAYFVLNAGDRIIIQRLLGSAEVGRYQVAYTVGYVVVLLLTFTSSAWTPRFAAVRDDGERWELSTHSRDALYRLLMPMLLGVTLAAPLALRVVAPPSYGPNSLVIVVFLVALAAFPVAASSATGRLLVIHRRGKMVAGIAGLAAVVNIGLNLLLVPRMGIAGAAAATFICYLILAALQRRALPKSPPWTRPPTRLVCSVVTVVAVAAGSTLLPQTAEWNIARVLVGLGCLPWFWLRLQTARRGELPTGTGRALLQRVRSRKADSPPRPR